MRRQACSSPSRRIRKKGLKLALAQAKGDADGALVSWLEWGLRELNSRSRRGLPKGPKLEMP
jgi:hypothetical protein